MRNHTARVLRLTLLALAGLSAATRQAAADQLSQKFHIDDANPEASVPDAADRDRNPLEYGYFIQDLLEQAEAARKRNDMSGVIRYYRAVAKAVPDNAKGWSKLCEAYAATNDHERASRACSYAVSLPGVELQDYARFVRETLRKDGPLSPADTTALTQVLDHLDSASDAKVLNAQLRCDVGVRTSDAAMLRTCTERLAQLAPSDPRTVIYQWSLAMQLGDKPRAAQLLARARTLEAAPASVARMAEMTYAGTWRAWPLWPAAAALAAALALGLGGAVLMRRRRAPAPAPAAAAR